MNLICITVVLSLRQEIKESYYDVCPGIDIIVIFLKIHTEEWMVMAEDMKLIVMILK